MAKRRKSLETTKQLTSNHKLARTVLGVGGAAFAAVGVTLCFATVRADPHTIETVTTTAPSPTPAPTASASPAVPSFAVSSYAPPFGAALPTPPAYLASVVTKDTRTSGNAAPPASIATGAFTIAGVLLLGATFFNRITKIAALGVDLTLEDAQAADTAAKTAAPDDARQQDFVKAAVLEWIFQQKVSVLQMSEATTPAAPSIATSMSPRPDSSVTAAVARARESFQHAMRLDFGPALPRVSVQSPTLAASIADVAQRAAAAYTKALSADRPEDVPPVQGTDGSK